jgi:hypothetical protein
MEPKTNELISLATKLQEAYLELAKTENNLLELASNITGLEISLTPTDGWQGKNEDTRRAAAAVTFNADETWRSLQSQYKISEIKARNLKAAIKGYEVLYDAHRTISQEHAALGKVRRH